MNSRYLEQARERVDNEEILVNLVARRVRQLHRGARPMVKPDSALMEADDVALKEIAEGLLAAEMTLAPEGEPELAGEEESSHEPKITL
ncbi:DNA-directed RNA polymerase subunit omega [Kiritimatiella glycovorans]|uniref:DNA-directed RNA polymerase subunit omega n=1 Tax=Kiritimatiella glycovorans TaxID=1307763 RepID=A0A0G3EEB1_9BACT|nr:DNA-directed RNA polymerase subunit omega [Kiritimatiella glycovorans]AKJ64658.1 hypothetical protein L21SP4_01411 [Kiritimatiella glycovorans]